MPSAALVRLGLDEFRSYPRLKVVLDGRPVVLTGANGAGKTNLLEAVSLLSPGRGLRGARLAEIPRIGGGDGRGWAVTATLRTAGGGIDIGTGCTPDTGDRRVVRIDGETVRSQSVLTEHLSIGWMTPQMDRLFVEGPAGRRRFLDRLVYGHDPLHARRLAAYERGIRERARLLRSGGNPAWLDAVEETAAAHAVAVAARRREAIDRLRAGVAAGVGPFPGAGIAVEGATERWLDEMPAVDAEVRLRGALAAARRTDAEFGGTGEGPHRSDFVVTHAGKGMPASMCSTGEQKALLIAILLADARLRTMRRGEAPVLLLDEVAAHLDAERRAALLAEIVALGAQAWCTGTDPDLFAAFGAAAQFLTVADGTVTETKGYPSR